MRSETPQDIEQGDEDEVARRRAAGGVQSLSGARQGLARINGTWRKTRVPWNAVQSLVGGRSRLGPLPTIRDVLRQSVPEACMVGAGASRAGRPCWQRVPMAWLLCTQAKA